MFGWPRYHCGARAVFGVALEKIAATVLLFTLSLHSDRGFYRWSGVVFFIRPRCAEAYPKRKPGAQTFSRCVLGQVSGVKCLGSSVWGQVSGGQLRSISSCGPTEQAPERTTNPA